MERSFGSIKNLALTAAREPLRTFRVVSSKLKFHGAYFSLSMAFISLGVLSLLAAQMDVLGLQNPGIITFLATSLTILWLALAFLWHGVSTETAGKNASSGGSPKTITASPATSVMVNFTKTNRTRKLASDPIKIAIVSDEFTALSIEHWSYLHPLTPSNFTEVLDHEDIQIVLIESAWKGHENSWVGKLRNGPSDEMKDLILKAKARRLPVIFWNKEDPVHFKDFIELACLADLVLTTDENCVERYSAAGVSSVEVMSFGINPLIHNTFGATHENSASVYAGAFYSKFQARSAKVAEFLTRIPPKNLIIRDRFYGNSNHKFPAALSSSIRPSLPYLSLLSEQKLYRAGLNFDTVTNSSTMRSRRVVELMASGVPVVSTSSTGTKEFEDKGLILVCATPEDMSDQLRYLGYNSHLSKAFGKTASRFALENLDTRIRFGDVLDRYGLDLPPRQLPSVDVICSTNRLGQLEHLLGQISRQNYAKILSVQIGLHGLRPQRSWLTDQVSKAGLSDKVNFSFHPATKTLGRVLDDLSKDTGADYVAKFDDDDFYFPNYLVDQVDAAIFTDAEVVGKWTRIVHVEDGDRFGLQFRGHENKFTKHVGGSTILAKKEAISLGFSDLSVGEDTDFLNRVRYDGGSIYSTDYLNYFYSRRLSGHTWVRSTSQIEGSLEFLGYGFPERYVEC